jgi:hypothetical protein
MNDNSDAHPRCSAIANLSGWRSPCSVDSLELSRIGYEDPQDLIADVEKALA